MDVRSELLRSNQISVALRNATQLTAQGKTAEARMICDRLLKTFPDDAEINNMAGVVAISEKRKAVALHHFQFAVSRAPNNVGYLNNLGRLFMKLDRMELAIPVYLRIVKLDPQYTTAVAAVGEFYEKMGRADRGLPFLENFMKAKPDNIEILIMYSRMLESVGRHSDAEEIYLRLERFREHRAVALNRLAFIKKHEEASPLLDRINTAIAEPGMPAAFVGILHSAAGKVLEDVGDYDGSFKRYQLAAEREVGSFDLAAFENRHKQMEKLFTPDFFAAQRPSGNQSDVPLLVVGMPRSGTTLTEQIIARHPQAGGAGELMRLRSMAYTLGFKRELTRFVSAMRAMNAEQLHVLAENYLQLLRFYSKDGVRVVDKLPHNFEMLGFAATLFPNIHIVHCKRDPIDTCLSIFVNRFNESHKYANDLTMLGLYYREYLNLMDFWKSALPVPVYESQYEELTGETEVSIRKLIDAVGLPWDDSCLSHAEAKSTVMTLSAWQVRQPIYKTSVKRWKRFEKHLGPLIDALGDRAEAA